MEALKSLTVRYFAMIPIQSMNHKDHFGEWESINWNQQSLILKATILHPRSKQRPPKLQYRINFIKFLISQLEKAGLEVCDLLYDTLGELMGQSSSSEGEFCYKTYALPSGNLLSIKESQQLVSKGTTGLRTWQAAQFLAEWAMENSHLLKNKHVVELGSGLGLTGLVVHTACEPGSLILSDCHPGVLNLLTDNIDVNLLADTETQTSDDTGQSVDTDIWRPHKERWAKVTDIHESGTRWQHKLAPKLQVAELHWERLTEESVVEFLGKVDVVLAADVVYDSSIIPSLVHTLKVLLRQAHSPKAFIASTIRNEATRQEFLQELDAHGIDHTTLPPPTEEVFFYDKSTAIELLQLAVRCSTIVKPAQSELE